MHDDCKWLVTPEILHEYIDVLRRPKFNLSPQTIQNWTELLEMRSVSIGSPPCTPEFPRDPKDAPFLAAALFGEADFLITGDKDLLQSRDTIPSRVVTVGEFAAEFQVS
jgi:putative PIN family toxin of toxin-antitoxin system